MRCFLHAKKVDDSLWRQTLEALRKKVQYTVDVRVGMHDRKKGTGHIRRDRPGELPFIRT